MQVNTKEQIDMNLSPNYDMVSFFLNITIVHFM
jgi:hypothetical protein